MQVPDQQMYKLLIEYIKAKTISNGPFNVHYGQFIMVTS